MRGSNRKKGREKIGKARNNENGTVEWQNVHLWAGKGREVCYISVEIKGDGGVY